MTDTILIIDDNEDILEFLSEVLGDTYKLHLAASGELAQAILESEIVDLIISDIMMPYVSGLEIVAYIQENFQEKKIPVIILSGMGQEDIVLEAFQLGADDFITKPFSPSELSVRVKRFSFLSAR